MYFNIYINKINTFQNEPCQKVATSWSYVWLVGLDSHSSFIRTIHLDTSTLLQTSWSELQS
jgi:hypothetical protein